MLWGILDKSIIYDTAASALKILKKKEKKKSYGQKLECTKQQTLKREGLERIDDAIYCRKRKNLKDSNFFALQLFQNKNHA